MIVMQLFCFVMILRLFSRRFSKMDFPGYHGDTRKDGVPHGYGTITFPNGNRYEGNWANGKRTGKGKYIYSNGSQYEGEVYDGHLHGKGTLTFANGNHYQGLSSFLVSSLQENSVMEKEKEVECLLGMTARNMKEGSKMTNGMAMGLITMQTKTFTKGDSPMDSSMATDHTITPMEINMKAILRKAKDMVTGL